MSNFYPQVKRTASIFFVLSLIAWGFSITPASAALGTFEPSYDASILITEPRSFFGDIKYLTVFEKNFPTGESRALVGFDLGLVPRNSKIISATLRLFVNNTEDISQDLEIYRNTQRWNERTLSWNARPKMAKQPSLKFTVSGMHEDFIELDVREDVQGFVSGDLKNYGWTIMAPNEGSGGVNFSSREDSLKERRPRLTLRYGEKNSEFADEYISDDGDFSAYSTNAGGVATKNVSQNSSEDRSINENSEANALIGEEHVASWHENILVGSVVVIFSMMFYIFWRKERRDSEI